MRTHAHTPRSRRPLGRALAAPAAIALTLGLIVGCGPTAADAPPAGAPTDRSTDDGTTADEAITDDGDAAPAGAEDVTATDGDRQSPTGGVEPAEQRGTDTDGGADLQPDADAAADVARTTVPSPLPANGDCSAAGASVEVAAVTGLPAAVEAARDQLIDAALRCDEQLLRTAMDESTSFTGSFGGDEDIIGLWWAMEADGQAPFLRLAQVLGTTPAMSDGGEVLVFPQVTTGHDVHTTRQAWSELTWLEDPASTAAQAGGYLDWRAGITPDGEWRFFVVGD